MPSLPDAVNVSYSGSNPLVSKLLGSYNAVMAHRADFMKSAEQKNLWAASASALYDLGNVVLGQVALSDIRSNVLGISNPAIESARPHIYEAVVFTGIEVLQRWYNSLMESGHDARNISGEIEKIKKGEYNTTAQVVDAVEKIATHIKIDTGEIKPEKGWQDLAESIEFEDLVRKGAIHIGVHL